MGATPPLHHLQVRPHLWCLPLLSRALPGFTYLGIADASMCAFIPSYFVPLLPLLLIPLLPKSFQLPSKVPSKGVKAATASDAAPAAREGHPLNLATHTAVRLA
eukprot:scaffold46821_cov19-Tisochrysis_lutea.AAC.6